MPVPSLRPIACLLVAALAGAQEESPRRTAHVGRVAEVAAPRIDGDLSDPCWRDAPAIGDLVMVEPWEGRAPTQRTVVKLLHDQQNLYLALWCFDDEPANIRATQRARDARLDPDDRVEILLDPFENRRTAYFFQIGPGGSIGDGLVSANGTRFDKPWDTIWEGEAHVTADGWVAEIAIPFRSIPRADGATSWGFNLRRHLRARHEEHQWANPVQAVSFFRVSELGTIEGFGAIDGGLGLRVVPYAAVGIGRDRLAAADGWGDDWSAGGELYYRVTPSLKLSATAHTDFAETEDDGRQINFNRFPLFFPEKREFFLDGTSYFAFGAPNAGGTTFLPFFSRRIGLAPDGSKVPLLGGVKLAGEVGRFEVGLLDVQTENDGGNEGQNLGALRLKYAVDAQTTVGLLATNGDPGGGSNQVAGFDLYHRWPHFVGDMDLTAIVDVLASSGDQGHDDGESFGAELVSQGSELEVRTGTRWVAADFDPALGFVFRRDSRASTLQTTWTPRVAEGSAVRNFVVDVDIDRVDEWDGTTQLFDCGIDALGLDTHAGDRIAAFASRVFEHVDQDFALFRGTTPVLAGDYWQTRGGGYVRTSDARPWDARVTVDVGDFFDGTRERLAVESNLRVSGLLILGADWSGSRVDLGPGRRFEAHVATGRVDLHFTPKLSLQNLVQFDNESDVLGWQSRLRWIHGPGSDFFAVLGTSWQRMEDGGLVPDHQELVCKVTWALRF